MDRLREVFATLGRDGGFFDFQNAVIARLYDALSQGYSHGENEVELVKRLVETANGQSYKNVSIHGAMLHGSRSYVEFSHRDRPVTTELGDMAILTIVTAAGDRLLQRLCIVQNKKKGSTSWRIDAEQLFLLRCFPPFTGNRGIFRGCSGLVFRNLSGCLGAYGLLSPPCEMIFSSAPLVEEMLRGANTLKADGISAPSDAWGTYNWMDRVYDWDLLEHWPPRETWAKFCGNTRFARDITELVRYWTQVNIGEITCSSNEVTNPNADAFANLLLRKAGFAKLAHLPPDNVFGDREFDGEMGVLLCHVDATPTEGAGGPAR